MLRSKYKLINRLRLCESSNDGELESNYNLSLFVVTMLEFKFNLKFIRHILISSIRSYSSRHGHISNRVPGKNASESGRNVILTLDPKKFAEKKQQRLNIGGKYSFSPQISLLKQSSTLKSPRIYCGKLSYKHRTFPPDTKAFLYYSIPPEKPRIAGELRLRVASSDNLASFESGSDLLLSDGRAWTRRLVTLSKDDLRLYEKLKEDGFISDDLHSALSTLPKKIMHNSPFYTLHDPFLVNFSVTHATFFVITEQGVGELLFQKVFTDNRDTSRRVPYTGAYTNRHLSALRYWYSHEPIGSALARFERSTLLGHKGTRTVVLRFLKIITPVTCVIPSYDGYISFPMEGELYQRRGVGGPDKTWSVDIDRSKGGNMVRCLRLLWEA